jgi:hypothetical protein
MSAAERVASIIKTEPLPDRDQEVVDKGTATAERLADSRLVFDAEFWNGVDDLEDYLVAPFLARGRGHALYAPAKAGKSLFGLYVAACAATGRAVLDQPAGTPLRVVYADLEMTRADVRERLVDMGYGADDDMDALIYYALPSLTALDTPEGGGDLVALAEHLAADLVVIDTISRAVQGEENSNDTAQNFAMHTGTPLKRAGITLLRIDHAGMDVAKGARGASAKNDDVDVVWQLLPRDRGKFTLKATHRRMNWVPEVVELRQDIEPLRYSLADSSWPAGTEAAVETLDRLAVPLDHGKTKARQALKAAGETMGNEVLMAALRFRRITAERHAEVQR